MKAVYVLLALFGSVCALQYPVEYQYHYEGRLATGIPSIRPQVASLGIKATLSLQMKAKSQGLAQLRDIEVGEYNEDLNCVQLRLPVPFRWTTMPEPYRKKLEQPFAVYFQEDMGHVMKVSQDEEEFITNIKKSIIEVLRIEPLIANLGGIKGDTLAKYVSGGRAPDSFSLEEESIFGRCESQYSVTKLSPDMIIDGKINASSHITVDEQSSKSPRSSSSIPKIGEQLYRLVRSINFDKCHDRVILQHTGMANMSEAGHSQFRSVHSRSSVSTYILKGAPGSWRMEMAIVEGDVVANPFGYRTHRLHTITNQTLALEKVQSIQSSIRLPPSTKDVKTWRFEVASPFSAPQGHPKPWMNYYTKNDKYYPIMPETTYLGIFPSDSDYEEYKKNFMNILERAIPEIFTESPAPSSDEPSWMSTKNSQASTHLYYMTRIIRGLPLKHVRDIFSQVFRSQDIDSQRRQMVVIDIASASGASAPIKVILEYIKNSKISHHRIGSIFSTIPNNLLSPSVIPELMEYVKSLDMKQNPILTSTALVNFASLAERICLNNKKSNYSVPNPVFGSEMCKRSMILDDFLSYLSQKAKDASTSWERSIYLQAVANLGTVQILPVLTPYIYGQPDPNMRVRMVAIYGLTRRRLPDSAHEEVFKTLMEIVDSLGERTEIRQAAFVSLLTWHPDAAWWQRMARSTWREPSQSMAAFITFTVESLAKATDPFLHKQARIAAFVLPLLKPYSPSFMYSYNKIFSRYDPVAKMGMNFQFNYIESPYDAIPSEIYSSLRENFGDLSFHMYEWSVASSNFSSSIFDWIASLKFPSSGHESYSFINSRNPSSRSSGRLSSEPNWGSEYFREDSEEKEANIYLRVFENLYQYIPINKDVISKIAGRDGADFMRKLKEGYSINMTKYFNPVDIEYFIPTEIGLPVVGLVSMPTMNLGNAEMKLEMSDSTNPSFKSLSQARNVSLLIKSNYKYMSKLFVRMQIPCPWNRKIAESAIENFNELNLPVYANLTFNHTEEIKNLTFNISPYTQQKFPLIYAHNIPFTQIRDYVPSADWRSDYKVIAVKKDRKPSLKVQKMFDAKYTGIPSELNYAADAPYPFTMSMALEYWRKPELSGQLMISPTSKQWQYHLDLDQRSSPFNISMALSYVTPRPMSGSQGIPDFSATDDAGQRLDKFRSFSEGSQVHGINAQLFFNSSEFRRYEAIFAITNKTQNSDTKEYKIMWGLLSDRIPQYTDSPKSLCSLIKFDTPNIVDFESLKKAVQSSPKESWDSSVFYGPSCSSSHIGSLRGSSSVSSERRSLLQEEMNKICNYDQKNPVVELQTAAVYDQISLEFNYEKDKIPTSLKNASYWAQSFIDGALFPHVYHNNMFSGSPNRISVTSNRPLWTDRYTFWADFPNMHCIFSEIFVPYGMTRIVPWSGLDATFDQYSNLIITPLAPYTCNIEDKKVRTYDKLGYDYTPTPCWTVAAVDSRDKDKFLVYSRKSLTGDYETHITMNKDAVEVEFSRSKVIVNGKVSPPSEHSIEVKNSKGEIVIKIVKFRAYVTATIIKTLTVTVKDDIEITPQFPEKGYLRGLCGDFDGSTKHDMTGPKNCLYSDDELFIYSWTTTSGDNCDKDNVEVMHSKVEDYQKNCPKRPGSFSKLVMESLYGAEKKSCNHYVYPVTKKNKVICASMTAVNICADDCTKIASKPLRVDEKCWNEIAAPYAVQQAVPVGYMDYAPPEPAKHVIHVTKESATLCRRSQ